MSEPTSPKHVAIIMDGNGRWAQARGLPRLAGHKQGAKTVRTILESSAKLGVQTLTLYSFSTENWRRPQDEVQGLMDMCIQYCAAERDELRAKDVRVRVLGSREGMRPDVLDALDTLEDATKDGSRITLALAINYGARDEIIAAARTLAQQSIDGTLTPNEIDHDTFAAALTTKGLPDPDLLIRTGGEQRLSNYLLYQLSYAELFFTNTPWPDFSQTEYADILGRFSTRSRRFGHAHESHVDPAHTKG